MQNCLQFLDYVASQKEAIVTYQASDMKLAIHSDASYLSKPKACSQARGHMFMAGREEIPNNNGAVLIISQIIKTVMSSAAEAELGMLYINAKQRYPCNTHWKNWATHNRGPPSKPTIQWRMRYSPTKSSPRH
jgi:hypothetical protein